MEEASSHDREEEGEEGGWGPVAPPPPFSLRSRRVTGAGAGSLNDCWQSRSSIWQSWSRCVNWGVQARKCFFALFSRCEKNSWELKVPSGQIGSGWEWYHCIGHKKDTNCYMFLIFNFDLEYLRRVQSSEPLHTKMPLIILLVGITGCMAEPCSKNAGESTIVLVITACEQNIWEKTNNPQSKPK